VRTALFRSDDDGATWAARQTWCCTNDERVSLAYDPPEPDHVFVVPTSGALLESRDGGETWRDPGETGLTGVRNVAFGVDGANVYAATDHGLFRLRLGRSTPAP
jgi:photosystem II stability/assembly factor-like uncharacterized protein